MIHNFVNDPLYRQLSAVNHTIVCARRTVLEFRKAILDYDECDDRIIELYQMVTERLRLLLHHRQGILDLLNKRLPCFSTMQWLEDYYTKQRNDRLDSAGALLADPDARPDRDRDH
jgi:hypothetical protein